MLENGEAGGERGNCKTRSERVSLVRFCEAAETGSGGKRTWKKEMVKGSEKSQRRKRGWMVYEIDDLEVDDVQLVHSEEPPPHP